MTSLTPAPALTWRPRTMSSGPEGPPASGVDIQPSPPASTESGVKREVEAEPLMTWPFVLVLLYFFADFGRPQDWFPPLAAIRPGMLTLGGGMVALWARRHTVYIPTRARLILAFLVLMAIGTPLATNRFFAFNFTRDFALLVFGAVIPIITFTNTYSRMQRLVSLLILIHVPLALYGITHDGFGVGSFMGDENDFCLALNVILPYVFFSFYFVEGARRKITLILVFGLLLFAVTCNQVAWWISGRHCRRRLLLDRVASQSHVARRARFRHGSSARDRAPVVLGRDEDDRDLNRE